MQDAYVAQCNQTIVRAIDRPVAMRRCLRWAAHKARVDDEARRRVHSQPLASTRTSTRPAFNFTYQLFDADMDEGTHARQTLSTHIRPIDKSSQAVCVRILARALCPVCAVPSTGLVEPGLSHAFYEASWRCCRSGHGLIVDGVQPRIESLAKTSQCCAPQLDARTCNQWSSSRSLIPVLAGLEPRSRALCSWWQLRLVHSVWRRPGL